MQIKNFTVYGGCPARSQKKVLNEKLGHVANKSKGQTQCRKFLVDRLTLNQMTTVENFRPLDFETPPFLLRSSN